MPADAKPESGAPRKLRVATFCGLIFGTLSEATPPIEDYLGPEIAARIRRVMKGPVRLLGGYSQMFPNNWKLYLDNVKDTYHASLLHSFFATFRLNRLSQQGGVIVGGDGGNHVSYTMMRTDTGEEEYEKAKMRSAKGGYRLEAPELLDTVDEIGDGISLQILARVSRLRAAADHEQPRGAPGAAEGRRRHRARLDLLRLRGATTRP